MVPRGARVQEMAHEFEQRLGICLSTAPQDGWTPLHFAASEGHATVVEQLLGAGAHIEAKSLVRGEGG